MTATELKEIMLVVLTGSLGKITCSDEVATGLPMLQPRLSLQSSLDVMPPRCHVVVITGMMLRSLA